MDWIARLRESYGKYRLIKASNQILSDYEKALAFAIKPSLCLNRDATFRKLRSIEKSYVDNWQAKLSRQPTLRLWLNGQEGLSYQAHYANTFLRLRLLTESHLAVWRIKKSLAGNANDSAVQLTQEQQQHLKERDKVVDIIIRHEVSLKAGKSSWYQITRPAKSSLWVVHQRLSNTVKKLKQVLITPEKASKDNVILAKDNRDIREHSIILRPINAVRMTSSNLGVLSVKPSKAVTKPNPSLNLFVMLYRGAGAVIRGLYQNNSFLNQLSRIHQRDIVTLSGEAEKLAQQQEENVKQFESLSERVELLSERVESTSIRLEEYDRRWRKEIDAFRTEMLDMFAQNLSTPSPLPEKPTRCEDKLLQPKNNDSPVEVSSSEVSIKGFLASGMSFLSLPDNKLVPGSAINSVEEKIIRSSSLTLAVH